MPSGARASWSRASRTTSCAEGGSGGRGGGPRPPRPPPPPRREEGARAAPALEQEREVRAAALADPRRRHRSGAEAVLVEEGADPVEDHERRPREPVRLGRGLDDVHQLANASIASGSAAGGARIARTAV